MTGPHGGDAAPATKQLWREIEEAFDRRHDGVAAAGRLDVKLRLYTAITGIRRFRCLELLTRAEKRVIAGRPA